MPEISLQLSNQQMHDLELMAKFHGVSASDLASAAFSASLSDMYELPSSGGTVTKIQGLFPATRGPKS